MNTTKMYIINTLSNMHVGSGEINQGVIDNLIQRDPVTDLPNINSSSLKGAIREFFRENNSSKELIKEVFGSDAKENTGSTTPGQARFFEANLLSIPVRSDKAPYLMATSPEVIDELIMRLELFQCAEKKMLPEVLTQLKKTIDKSLPSDPSEKWAFVLDPALTGAVVEEFGLKAERLNVADDNHRQFIEKLFGKNPVILSHEAFSELCDNNHLPVLARNNLDNGVSTNLWYEQVLPRYTRLYFMLMDGGMDPVYENDFSEELSDGLFQLGGNASIGYGFCRFIDASTLKPGSHEDK